VATPQPAPTTEAPSAPPVAQPEAGVRAWRIGPVPVFLLLQVVALLVVFVVLLAVVG
jgi:hypothetical protein